MHHTTWWPVCLLICLPACLHTHLICVVAYESDKSSITAEVSYVAVQEEEEVSLEFTVVYLQSVLVDVGRGVGRGGGSGGG